MKSIHLIIRINTGSTLTVLNQVLKLYEYDTISFNIPKLNSGQTLEVLASTSDINRVQNWLWWIYLFKLYI